MAKRLRSCLTTVTRIAAQTFIVMRKRAAAAAGGAEASAAKRRRVRTPEEIVAQCLRDNFKGWPDELVDVKRVAGKTLRETIAADKVAQKTMGGLLRGLEETVSIGHRQV